jgi:hypothetical protein
MAVENQVKKNKISHTGRIHEDRNSLGAHTGRKRTNSNGAGTKNHPAEEPCHSTANKQVSVAYAK